MRVRVRHTLEVRASGPGVVLGLDVLKVEPAVPVLALRVQQGDELEERATLRATDARCELVVVVEQPL